MFPQASADGIAISGIVPGGPAEGAGLQRGDLLVARLVVIAYITDQMNIRKLLDHLGLSPPENPRPAPELHYVPVDDEGWEAPLPAVQ